MSIDDQVDVLGESFDNAKGFRKRSSAFENELVTNRRIEVLEKNVQK